MTVLAKETDQRTRRLEFSRVAPSRSSVGIAALAAVVALAALVPLALVPGSGERVRRFALPWYTPPADVSYRIVVSSGEPVVRRGEPVTLSAYLEPTRPGAVLPSTAALVVRGPGSKGEKTLTMTASEGAAFHLTLPGVADDFEYRVAAGPARSEWHKVIAADPVALTTGTTLTLHPPGYAEGVVGSQVREGFAEFDVLQYGLRGPRPAVLLRTGRGLPGVVAGGTRAPGPAPGPTARGSAGRLRRGLHTGRRNAGPGPDRRARHPNGTARRGAGHPGRAAPIREGRRLDRLGAGRAPGGAGAGRAGRARRRSARRPPHRVLPQRQRGRRAVGAGPAPRSRVEPGRGGVRVRAGGQGEGRGYPPLPRPRVGQPLGAGPQTRAAARRVSADRVGGPAHRRVRPAADRAGGPGPAGPGPRPAGGRDEAGQGRGGGRGGSPGGGPVGRGADPRSGRSVTALPRGIGRGRQASPRPGRRCRPDPGPAAIGGRRPGSR